MINSFQHSKTTLKSQYSGHPEKVTLLRDPAVEREGVIEGSRWQWNTAAGKLATGIAEDEGYWRPSAAVCSG